jgi:uncharacterized protein (TIGR02266 family)
MRPSSLDLNVARTERRAASRRRLEVEVSLTSDSTFFAGLSGDVSTGGIFVSTYELKPVGTQVDLVFAIAETVIETRGVVRWVQEAREGMRPGMGIAFESLSAGELKRIEEFCQARPPLYYDVDDVVEELHRLSGVGRDRRDPR